MRAHIDAPTQILKSVARHRDSLSKPQVKTIHKLLVSAVVQLYYRKNSFYQAQMPDPLAKLPVVFNVNKLYKADCEHHLQMRLCHDHFQTVKTVWGGGGEGRGRGITLSRGPY